MRKKREIERFARWCFAQCGVPPCKITYAPGKSLIRNGKYGFGLYIWDDGTRDPGDIFVAYRIPKWGVMSTVAHEIVHHRQQMRTGLDNMDLETSESEAEKIALELMGLWLIRGGKVKPEEGRTDDVGKQQSDPAAAGS